MRPKAPFDKKAFKIAMETAGVYICGGNFAHENPFYSASPGVPINKRAVDDLMSTVFAKPVRFPGAPGNLTIALESSEIDPCAHRGALQSISAEELRHAYWLAIARDIEDGRSKEVMARWRQCILSCPFEFRAIGSEDERFWAALNLRNREGKKLSAVMRTAWQKLNEIMKFRQRREAVSGKLTHVQVAELYKKNGEALSAEDVSPNFFENASVVWHRALQFESVRQVISKLDYTYGSDSPLNSMTKLYGVTVRAKTPEQAQWAFSSLFHVIQRKMCRPDDCNTRNLTGLGSSGKTERCWVDLFNFKFALKGHLLDHVVEQLGFPSEFKAAVRAAFHDHAAFEKSVSPCPGSTTKADLSWQVGLKQSALLLAKFIEECLYTTVHDGSMKTALKSRKIPEEWLKYAEPTEALDAVSDALAAEKKATDDAQKEAQAKGDANAANDKEDTAEGSTVQDAALACGRDELSFWRALADRTVASHVTLIVEPGSETQLGNAIKSSGIGSKSYSGGNQFLGVFLDVKCACESATQPATRMAPLREEQYGKLVRGAPSLRHPWNRIAPRRSPAARKPPAALPAGLSVGSPGSPPALPCPVCRPPCRARFAARFATRPFARGHCRPAHRHTVQC